jgi:hypothetical protein
MYNIYMSTPPIVNPMTISIITHGKIWANEHGCLDTTTVPDNLTVTMIRAAACGVINVTFIDDANKINDLIFDELAITPSKILDDAQLKHLIEQFQTVIQTEDPVMRLYAKVQPNPQHLCLNETFDRRYQITTFPPGSQMVSKDFTIDQNFKMPNAGTIMSFNPGGVPDKVDVLPYIISEEIRQTAEEKRNGKKTITLLDLLKFIKSIGCTNVCIFDFSCSVIEDYHGDEITKRAQRVARKGASVEGIWGGKRKTKKRRKGKKRRNISKRRKTIKK